MEKGIFITFEGVEGCGKSFHIKKLAEYFAASGRKCLVSREPGGTPISEKIRSLLLDRKQGENMFPRTEILLFEAARAQHVEELIKPALARGEIVMSDRFFDSTTAYQGAARKISPRDVDFLNGFAVGGCVPDLTIILDIPVGAGLARAAERDGSEPDRMGGQRVEFYEAARSAFLSLAESDPRRFAVVDSSGGKEETFSKILSQVKGRLNV